jgi:hypothetical protein
MADLCRASSQANLTIGVLGNSITFGAGVRPDEAWPAQFEAQLRRRLGPRVRVLNGAVRASSADFAALCWDEVWRRAGAGTEPRLDLAIVDYTYTSSHTQIQALVRKLHALRMPVLALLYCPHPAWKGELLKLVSTNATELAGYAAMPTADRRDHPRVRSRADRLTLLPVQPIDTLAAVHAKGTVWKRAALGVAALQLAMEARTFRSNKGFTRADRVEALHHLGALHSSLKATDAQDLSAAISGLAMAWCMHEQHRRTIVVLKALGVPYASNAEQLLEPAEDMLLDSGRFGAHPNARGHSIIASTAVRLFSQSCGSVTLPVERHTVDDQVCHVGERLERSRCSGFAFVDPGEGRTPGLVSMVTGATCELRVASRTIRAGFVSLALERGWRNSGLVDIQCVLPCWCLPSSFEVGTSKPYTFSQRTSPRWTELGPDGTCVLRVSVRQYAKGRVMIQAVTLSAANSKNRSIDTGSLYSLLG